MRKGFFMQNEKAKKITRAGIIASLYTVTTLLTMPVASGAVQIRIGEALTLLPLLYVESIPALFVGCILSNLISGCAFFDIVFGSLITLFASVLTFLTGKIIKNTPLKIIVGGLFPVLLNAFLLPLIWVYCYGALEYIYGIQALLLIAGQGVSVYLIGSPLVVQIKKYKNKNVGFLQ